jgi:phenylalanyl-tRNA synthetase beta chain
MRAPVSWLREYADLPAEVSARRIAERLVALGLEVERIDQPGAEVAGALVVGRVADFAEERHSNGKTIRWCEVEVGPGEARGIVCGARNFAVGELVVVALPGATLPGGFRIEARRAYGHLSDGMICSARELGVGADAAGILVLSRCAAKPGDDAAELLGLGEPVLEIAVTPDRGYCLSIRGVSREAATAFAVGFQDPAERSLDAPASAGYPVRVEDPGGCPVFAVVSVDGFNPGRPSPDELRRRVELAGMRPISLAVDVTNYVMLELGQPLHGYDADRLRGPIRVRRAGSAEKLTTLDGVRRTLAPEDLVIADDSGAVGLAGVMGGESTELTPTTSRVVVEGASFDPATVGRTARRHRLASEASRRFERGVDPALPLVAALRAAALLTRFGGGRIVGATLVGEVPPRAPVPLLADHATRVLGTPVGSPEAHRALVAVGCRVDDSADAALVVHPPSWRPDLQDPNDLVEEIARLRGYDTIPSRLPVAAAGRGLTPNQRLRRRIGTGLAGAGFVEVVTYPFVGDADWAALGLAADDGRRRALRLENPLSEQEPLLRTTLLPGLGRVAARNVGRGRGDLALFECGPVYLPGPDLAPAPRLGVDAAPSAADLARLEAALPDQPRHLGLLLAGHRSPAGWWGAARPVCWADAVAGALRVGALLGLSLTVRAARRPPWHPGRCAEVLLDGVGIGFAGELHPRVCAALRLPPRSAAAELDLEPLLAAAPAVTQAPALSVQPVAKEDIALVVDAGVPAAKVEQALRAGAGELLESVRLFDVYTGEQVPVGAKSLAFALRLRAFDRTLTEAEATAARDAAVAEAARTCGAVQRS